MKKKILKKINDKVKEPIISEANPNCLISYLFLCKNKEEMDKLFNNK